MWSPFSSAQPFSPTRQKSRYQRFVVVCAASLLGIPAHSLFPVAAAMDKSQVIEIVAAASPPRPDVLECGTLTSRGFERQRSVADEASPGLKQSPQTLEIK
jgi:hypothetical protein